MKKADIKASTDTLVVEPLDGEEKHGSIIVSATAGAVLRGRILTCPSTPFDDGAKIGDTVFYLPWNVHENSPHNPHMGDAANTLVEFKCEDGDVTFVGYSRVVGYAKAVRT